MQALFIQTDKLMRPLGIAVSTYRLLTDRREAGKNFVSE